MIMPCMNRTSAGERGSSVALVEGGSVRVGSPGAPGCTKVGVARSACCAHTDSENKPARVLPAISLLRQAFITDRSLRLRLNCKDDVECSSIEGVYVITKRQQVHVGVRPAICAISFLLLPSVIVMTLRLNSLCSVDGRLEGDQILFLTLRLFLAPGHTLFRSIMPDLPLLLSKLPVIKFSEWTVAVALPFHNSLSPSIME